MSTAETVDIFDHCTTEMERHLLQRCVDYRVAMPTVREMETLRRALSGQRITVTERERALASLDRMKEWIR